MDVTLIARRTLRVTPDYLFEIIRPFVKLYLCKATWEEQGRKISIRQIQTGEPAGFVIIYPLYDHIVRVEIGCYDWESSAVEAWFSGGYATLPHQKAIFEELDKRILEVTGGEASPQTPLPEIPPGPLKERRELVRGLYLAGYRGEEIAGQVQRRFFPTLVDWIDKLKILQLVYKDLQMMRKKGLIPNKNAKTGE